MFVDGNRNGVRRQDIEAGVDRPLGASARLHELFPGVRIGLVPEGALSGSAVRFGESGLVTFTPIGTATPGSVYVVGRDGTQYAVRVVGATARTRVLRYRENDGAWVNQ